jgi:hypothetical protein
LFISVLSLEIQLYSTIAGSINDNINIDSTIAGSINDNINIDSTIAGSINDNINSHKLWSYEINQKYEKNHNVAFPLLRGHSHKRPPFLTGQIPIDRDSKIQLD